MKFPKSSKPPKKPDDIHVWPFVFRHISGHSMVPILPPGTNVVGSRWFRLLNQGDVIIFEHEGIEKIKRIDKFLPDGTFHVLGEHLDTSTDSRHFGSVDKSQVIAKVIWPSTKKRR